MKSSNFDLVAPIYDALGKIIFGNHLIKAQTVFLEELKPHDKVLILGGGSGWILEKINRLNIPLSITYVEPSAKMMKLSKARGELVNLKVDFIQRPFEEVSTEANFDVICTFFFLDLFTLPVLKNIILKIKKLTHKNSKWLFADFYLDERSPNYHHWLVKLMYTFFRVFSNLASDQLLDFHHYITSQGFSRKGHKKWKNGLIHSSVFKRPKSMANKMDILENTSSFNDQFIYFSKA